MTTTLADIDWPSDLPGPSADEDFEQTATETKVQDSGDVGSPRARNRFTRLLESFSLTYRLTEAQKEALLAFYDDTLDRGVENFNWTHPTTGRVYVMKLTSRPTVKYKTFSTWSCECALQEQ